MKPKRPCQRLATYIDAIDGPASIEGVRRICVTNLKAAVVDRPVAKTLIRVEIDTSPRAVVHDEVPRAIVAPRVQPIHPHLSENDDHLLKFCRLQPEIEIRMNSGLFTEQRVDRPATAKAHIDPTATESSQQLDS